MVLLKIFGLLAAMLAVVGFGLCGIVIADANRETRTAILVVVGALLVFLLFTLGSVVWKGIKGSFSSFDSPP